MSFYKKNKQQQQQKKKTNKKKTLLSRIPVSNPVPGGTPTLHIIKFFLIKHIRNNSACL